ncbi:MAG: DUF111 family protein, partial [Desulfovibrionales bacterium]|nr:DUF111 family protein [Desulfovibrionales bacterium]
MQKTLIQKNKIPGDPGDSILYFDCLGGISGNMVVGALLDLGLPLEKLRGELKKLSLKGYHCRAHRSKKYPISSIFFEVDVREKTPPERRFVDIR